MKTVKSKDRLIQYLSEHKGIELRRDEVLSETGISKSRLSELIKDLRSEGYSITAPKRSGLIRLDNSENVQSDIRSADIRLWLILMALSVKGKCTYVDLINFHLSLVDSNYLLDPLRTNESFSDTDIMTYLDDNNPAAAADIRDFLPLSTFRSDLKALCRSGYVEYRKEQGHYYYCLSEKSPSVLLKSDEDMYDFRVYFDHRKNSFQDIEPLAAVYEKICNIYNWDNDCISIQMYGKNRQVAPGQMAYLEKLVRYPYKTKILKIYYKTSKGNKKFRYKVGLIFFSSELNRFYALVRDADKDCVSQIRLDKIDSIEPEDEKNDYFHSIEIMDIYDEMFSYSYSRESCQVKILFEDYGNITERVSALHRKRKNSCFKKLEKPIPGMPYSYLYTDTIRGISSFEPYLRSFGSSALVIEPAFLRKKMIASGRKLLRRYEEVQNE